MPTPSQVSLWWMWHTAYPSGLDLPKDVEGVKVSLCISNGTQDLALKADGVEEVKSSFARKEGFAEGKYERNVVRGAKHGIAIRSNPADESEEWMGQLAEERSVGFSKKMLVDT